MLEREFRDEGDSSAALAPTRNVESSTQTATRISSDLTALSLLCKSFQLGKRESTADLVMGRSFFSSKDCGAPASRDA
jgi:hypothetical protein